MAYTNYMGFDDYIYIVRVTDEAGEVTDFEFGNLSHALDLYESQEKASILKYKDGREIPTEYTKN